MTEIVQHQPQQSEVLNTQMRFAEAVTKSGGSILPKAYQANPGNALIAINLGSSMGLAPAESLYRIDVIQGTPTASAELVASNVRKAGHKLRVKVDEAAQSVTAEIIRADDPGYTYTVTRDMKWAQQMGLATKDNYKKQPMTMLQWRAITAVARLAASEALYGVGYTADEVQEMGGRGTTTAGVTAAQFTTPAADTHGQDDLRAAIQGDTGEAPSDAQLRKMFAVLKENGLEGRDEALGYVSETIGRPIESRNELTRQEVSKVLDSFTPAPEEN